MKRNKPVTHQGQAQERETLKLDSWKIANVRETQYGVFLDLTLNGVTIYGAKVIDGVEGKYEDFIAMPSRKGKGADGSDRYFNIVYAPLSSEDTKAIIQEIEKALGFES